MRKFMSLALALAFVLGISISLAIGNDGTYLKWDVGQDGSFNTSVTVPLGNTVTVDLYVTDIPVSSKGACSFEVGKKFNWDKGMNHDPSWLQCNSITIDNTDWPLFTYIDWTSSSGNINAKSAAPLSVGYTCNKKLMTIEFQCLGPGTETLDFTETSPDVERFYLGELGGDEYTVDAITYALTIICGVPANYPPVAKDQPVVTNKNQSRDITLEATDADGDSLTYSVDNPSHGTLDATNIPDVTYTPDSDYIGSDSFTFKANDGEEDSNKATVSITVKEEGDFQSITPDPNSVNARPGEEFTFSIEYDASDNALTGLVFYVHYNSSYLEFDEVSNIFKKCYMGLTDPEDDIDDKDGNIFTDKRFLVAWADLTPPPSWPGTELPLSLMDITFHVKEWICPPLYTSINFSVKDTAQGYAFLSTPMELNIVSFHLDIDDNGKVEALTDGLLIIRYLFGFTGEDLVNGAIGFGANRDDPDEIADWIETGILEGHLDIDDNGAVTPLTDGLLVIRYLFGFTGGDLVMGATDPGGGRISPDGIEDYIENYLMPSS